MNRLEESLYNPERRFGRESQKRNICNIYHDPWDKPMFGCGGIRPIEHIKSKLIKPSEPLFSPIQFPSQESSPSKLPEFSLYNAWEGSSWGKSFEPTELYIKDTPIGSLHVHHTEDGLITGAKLFNEEGETKISNYESAMLDLLSGNAIKKKGLGEW